ncbi:DUF1178 family protein [Sphingosinicellaceae bacterium]|nr:DUF1178 family protein [Sphingosinicellaceae bacterium]
MIVFDLRCGEAHVFEAWFGSTADYDSQSARGLVACPICGDGDIGKAAMAPAVPSKSNRAASPAEVKQGLAALARVQAEVLSKCDYVGGNFANEARAIDAGEAVKRGIYGEATRAEVAGLVADGIQVGQVPLPIRAKADA